MCENAVDVTLNNRNFKLKFKIVAITGDTQGLNDIMGHMNGRPTRFCRVCLTLRPYFQARPWILGQKRTREFYQRTRAAILAKPKGTDRNR